MTSRRYRSVVNPWASIPSATSPATSVIRSPTAARKIRRVAVGVGTRIEHRGHQGVAVELAPEGQAAPVGPARPDGPDGQDELAHPGSRVGPRHGEALLDVGLDLGAEPEHEPALGHGLEVVGHHGQGHRVAGEGNSDAGAELDAARCARRPASGGGTGRGWSRRTRCRRSRPARPAGPISTTPLGSNPMPPSTCMGHA